MLQFKHKKNEKNVQIVQREVRMKKLLYRPKDAWVGDLIPYYENGTFYGYYLHDPRIRDKEYAEETTWHLVTTKDFVNVEYKGEAIKRGGDDKPNKNAYTGSVIKDKENLYHAFFTAYNEDIKINSWNDYGCNERIRYKMDKNMIMLPGTAAMLPYLTHGKSRAINAENRTGEKGKGGMAASGLGKSRKGSPCLNDIQPGETVVLGEIDGPGIIHHIWITTDNKTSEGDCFVLRDLVLRMYWDGEENPSVEAPLGDFFCCGFGKECYINSSLITVVPSRGLNSYIQMPFKKKAVITLENQHANAIPAFFYQIDYNLYNYLPEETEYFHASWRREALTELGKDYVIADGIKGSGHYIGTYIALSTLQRYWWGEGEVKFYIDGDEQYPTICGTGMEDYFGGSWSFARHENGKTIEQTYTTPFLGYPYYSRHDDLVNNLYHNDDCPPMRGFYRWHVMDPVFFDEELKVTVQQIGVGHKGLFERQDDLSSVAYWYQKEPHNVFLKLPEKEKRWPR